MKTAFVVVVAFLALGYAEAEYIFRGQCTSLFQSQEVSITVDTSDVVFGLYIINPRNKSVANADACMMDCLGVATPPCRTAIYEPFRKTCWLLRADKQTALEFDTRNAVTPLSGILITPQNLVDTPSDRKGGVASCDSFCPAPATESADTVTPVCVRDCPNDDAVCAGELANCMDYNRRVTVHQPNTYWHFGGAVTDYTMTTMTVTKKHDYTYFRISISMSWVFRSASSSTSYWDQGYMYVAFSNGMWCNLENGWNNYLLREVQEVYSARDYGEPASGEFPCHNYEFKKGTYTLYLKYDYRSWSGRWPSSSAPGLSLTGKNAPVMMYVEEYIPAEKMFKLDDMARCQSATLFNSVTRIFHTSYTSTGRTNYYVWKYKKRSDTSTLRIIWQGVVQIAFYRKAMKMYFTINDKLCDNPYSIETTWREYNYNGWNTDMASPDGNTAALDGVCRGLPAGKYDIALWVEHGSSAFSDQNQYWHWRIGRDRPSYMTVEEIHENLPTNALLLSNGEMVKMPNFNRQYFPFTTGCHEWAGHSCYNPIDTFTYTKLHDNSHLHIKWYGTQTYCTNSASNYNEAPRFYVQINGAECSSPLKVESAWFFSSVSYGICRTRPKYVEGVCKMTVPAGAVSLTLHLGQFAPWGSFGRLYGVTHGGTSYLMVEEVYDGDI